MEKNLLKSELAKFEPVCTWMAEKTYFIAATVKGKYEPCVVIFTPEPQSSGEIFLHQMGSIIPLEIDEIYESSYKIEPKFLNLLIKETRHPINYFVFEMNDGKMFNYCLKPSTFFVYYPENYTSRDIKIIHPNKMFIENKLIDFDNLYKDKISFYKAHDYIPGFL